MKARLTGCKRTGWYKSVLVTVLGGAWLAVGVCSQASSLGSGYYSTPGMPNNPRHYMQLSLGRYQTYSSAPASSAPDRELTWERSLNTVGFVAQVAPEPGDFQYGLEGGTQIAYSSNSTYTVVLSGSDSRVAVRSEHWMGDFFLGGFVSIRSVAGLRFYASAGPVVYWGRVGNRNSTYRIEDRDGNNQIIVDLTDEQEDIGLGVYGRLGVEVTVNSRVNLGLSVRQTNGELDFDHRGTTSLDEPSYMFTVGYHY